MATTVCSLGAWLSPGVTFSLQLHAFGNWFPWQCSMPALPWDVGLLAYVTFIICCNALPFLCVLLYAVFGILSSYMCSFVQLCFRLGSGT